MKLGKLKELLEQFEDEDLDIVLDSGDLTANVHNEIVCVYKVGSTLRFQTRDDFDVEEELNAYLKFCAEENYDEADSLQDLFSYGYTLDDFKYDPARYEWAKQIAEEHGLI